MLQQIILTELFGTALLVLLGNGIVANVVLKGTKGQNAGWISITAGWGFAVFIAAGISAGLGGVAHLNPAVTIMFAIQAADKTFGLRADALTKMSGVGLFFIVLLVQFIGAMLGSIFVDLLYWKHILSTKTDNDFQPRVLAIHSTGATNRAPILNFLMEFVGTVVLLVGIWGLTATKSSVFESVGPLAVGLLVFGIGLSLGGTTGYAINPARDLGPRLVHTFLPLKDKGSSEWSYSWIPGLGPVAAAVFIGLIAMAVKTA
ncbi:MIP/aquaporin family protein [Mycoplasma feriruminatoris]|uniref:MIP/aquaporin family protein n=1 Tax=Mycoplasma feriruminatoris TaxID=1179777 RepID=UPI00241D7BAB|nr:MIP/aquaporin family protein [Mycoplasma feriruminatoris]WFQ94556.1 putative glycerol uptake facilitator protein [Mycoplasma feriruminatoris]